MLSVTSAGTISRTCPELAGSTVLAPSYTASTSRDGPAGSVALHTPSWAVVVTAACVYAFRPLLGAVRMRTVCPASATPSDVPSQPTIFAVAPCPTRLVLSWIVRGGRTCFLCSHRQCPLTLSPRRCVRL